MLMALFGAYQFNQLNLNRDIPTVSMGVIQDICSSYLIPLYP